MKLTIVLRKEVADVTEGDALTEIVRNKLSDHPEVEIKASVSEDLPNHD